jgi:hypothetical protein
LKLRVWKREVQALTRAKLHGEKCIAHFRWPSPGIQFLFAGARVQFEKKLLVLGPFGTKSDSFQSDLFIVRISGSCTSYCQHGLCNEKFTKNKWNNLEGNNMLRPSFFVEIKK